MGSRGGRLHNEQQQLVRVSAGRRWIACVLEFKGRRREVMGPGYTELFFLDEASALAAGHRPCHECRRDDARRFQEAWAHAHGVDPTTLLVDAIDRALHAERLVPVASRPMLLPGELPAGSFVLAEAGRPFLLWDGAARAWTGSGYEMPAPLGTQPCVLLTPPSIVATLRAGYVPAVHRSAVAP
jgi:hypothetical protein